MLTKHATQSQAARNVAWMLERFVRRTAGVRQAIQVSAAGDVVALAPPLARDQAQALAHLVNGLATMAGQPAMAPGAGLSQTVLSIDSGYLLATMTDGPACLAVITDESADLVAVSAQAVVLAGQLADLLTPELIDELALNLAA